MQPFLDVIQDLLLTSIFGAPAWVWLISAAVVLVVGVNLAAALNRSEPRGARRDIGHSRPAGGRARRKGLWKQDREADWQFNDSKTPTLASEPVAAPPTRREGVGAAAQPVLPRWTFEDTAEPTLARPAAHEAPPTPADAAPTSDWDRWKVSPELPVPEAPPVTPSPASIGAASEWAIDEERARHWQRRAAVAADRRYGKSRRELGHEDVDEEPAAPAPSRNDAAPPALAPEQAAASIGERLRPYPAALAPNPWPAPDDGPRVPIDIHDFGSSASLPASVEDEERPRPLSKSVDVEAPSDFFADDELAGSTDDNHDRNSGRSTANEGFASLDLGSDDDIVDATSRVPEEAKRELDELLARIESREGPKAAAQSEAGSVVPSRVPSAPAGKPDDAAAPERDVQDTLSRTWAKSEPLRDPEVLMGTELTAPAADQVECSLFARPKVTAGTSILIQALLHQSQQLAAAIRMAHEIDPSANRRSVSKLRTRVRRGTPVELFLESPDLAIEQPMVSVIWDGDPIRAVFAADVSSAARGTAIEGTLHMFVGGAPVGELTFELQVEQRSLVPPDQMLGLVTTDATGDLDDLWEDTETLPVATRAIAYSRAFISYARKDFERVSFFAEALNDCGIRLLFDLTSLEPGDEWDQRLVELVDRADVFYLMWSDNSACSAAVAKEIAHAIKRYEAANGRMPRIRPVMLHQPGPQPPDYLSRFHFNSQWVALRAAQQQPLFAVVPAAG